MAAGEYMMPLQSANEPPFPPQSSAMRFFHAISLESTAWSLRRLHCPVKKDALVLEVGSGSNPYPRANVLMDAYEETRERHWAPLVVDRPFVLGFIEHMPFKTKAFDFLIASHILEHSPDPEKTLKEFQRVARAGYIETPDAFMERINPYRDHRLEITLRNKKLEIRKKMGWLVDSDLVTLYESRVKPLITGNLIRRRPFEFHVRYYWQETIQFVLLNPETDAAWLADQDGNSSFVSRRPNLKQRLRHIVIAFLWWVFSQSARNRKIDVFSLLQCPTCGSDELTKTIDRITCRTCQAVYPLKSGIPVMLPKKLVCAA